MTTLVIVESPSKAKTVEKYLGEGFDVRASVGHVRDLPKSNKDAVDIDGGFVPRYEVVEKKRDVIADLKRAAKGVDEVILATDPDREGEAIAWHVARVLGLKNPRRIVFNEITKNAVQEALAHPRGIDEDLLKAQEARRVLDRLVGYDLSGLLWKKIRYGLSAGRVQSPALRILVEREREIAAFVPEDFWIISADVLSAQERPFTLTCIEEPRDEKRAEAIVAGAKGGSWRVADVTEREVTRRPRAPFTTSTLQQSASSRLGFSPSRTMRTAQKLYEAGLITYMRTDSTTLAKQAVAQAASVVTDTFGKELSQPKTFATKSKNAQEAHEAVRPTNLSKKNAGRTEEQKKLYTLIWERTIASQMVDATMLQTKITADVDDDTVPSFTANGSRVVSPGWLLADPRARGEDTELPAVSKNEMLTLSDVHSDAKQTTPPPRYSEAGLVKELEKRGIGRPSTYASIIDTIVKRGYVTKEGRALKPTDTGDVVSGFLEAHFPTYISDSFTSEMENELDEIARGEREYAKTLNDFYTPFHTAVEEKTQTLEKATNLGAGPKEFPCPKCGKDMVIKLGRGGKFLSCSDFPECHGARTIDGEEIKETEPIGKHPETEEPVFVLRGPYGHYVQLGEKSEKNKKPKRASIPEDMQPDTVTLADAVKLLALPRELGKHPETDIKIVASIGRFGPYVGHMTKPKADFRSLKEDDVFTINLPRALEIFAEPKKRRGGKGGKKKGA